MTASSTLYPHSSFPKGYLVRMHGDRSLPLVRSCLIQVQERCLRNDVPVAVGTRGLKLLAALVGRPGEILGKAELMDAAWPGTAVEEANLTVQIAQLRKLLGPAAGGGEWIATVPRVGYRFAGAVEQLGGAGENPCRCPASRRSPCCPSSMSATIPNRTPSRMG